ncbi:unnamed protein product [Effrenium voratum]|nr:unnamed protein product [Effrenium voratum]
MERQIKKKFQPPRFKPQQMRRGGSPPEEEEEAEGREPLEVLTAEEKKMIKSLHSKLGYPSIPDFARMLRLARARAPVWKYVQKDFKCSVCESQVKPKAARPAVPPRCLQAGEVVGVDVLYFPGLNPREAKPVLSMVCWGSCYQMLETMMGKSADEAWRKRIPWIICGPDDAIWSSHKTIGARAPWQQGRTERRGGLAKNTFLKMREEAPPLDWEEWKQCISAVESAKKKGGFSPAQRMLGENARLPGTLGSDDPYDPAMLVAGAGEPARRVLEIRRKAMKAFIRAGAEAALDKAMKARPRQLRSFSQGELVYVYRSPRPRKKGREEDDHAEARELRRPVWVGPGVIVMTEGPNAWVGVYERRTLEQVRSRSATNEESDAAGLLEEEFAELRASLNRAPSKRAYNDISQWSHPPEDAESLPGGGDTSGFFEASVDEHPTQSTEEEDYWEWRPVEKVLRRVHVTARTAGFVPRNSNQQPMPIRNILAERKTYMRFDSGDKAVVDNSGKEIGGGPPRQWRGFTDFKLHSNLDTKFYYLIKKGSDEVKEEDIPAEDWEQWRVADGEEWSKVYRPPKQ